MRRVSLRNVLCVLIGVGSSMMLSQFWMIMTNQSKEIGIKNSFSVKLSSWRNNQIVPSSNLSEVIDGKLSLAQYVEYSITADEQMAKKANVCQQI